jgi:dTDP-4-amino-4,6-dideoxygalactose transaminase
MAMAEKHDLMVIEYCAHAIETGFHGKPAGTLGGGCFSFYVTKNVMTGEGGVILGRDEEHIARARLLELHDLSVPEHPHYQQRFS